MKTAFRSAICTFALALGAGGCSAIGLGGDGEEVAPPEASPEARRAVCDQYAARAVDVEDLTEARRLAARATECYAAEIARRG